MRAFRGALALTLVAAFGTTAAGAGTGSGSIGGTVTDEAGFPIAGICVAAESYDSWYSSAETAADGTYSITGLTDGAYLVSLSDCTTDPRYLTEWFDDKAHPYEADPVVVFDGAAVAGIDAALTLGGFVAGTLTDDDGDPASTCVNGFTDQDGWIDGAGTAITNADDGSWRLGPLAPGEVQLRFGACSFATPVPGPVPTPGVAGHSRPPPAPSSTPWGYVPEWFNDRHGFGGDPVPVVAGVTTPGIDAVLALAGGVVGTVTDESGAPLANMCVAAEGTLTSGYVSTDENGFYAVNQLAAGSYKMGFFDCSEGIYRSEWFDDQPSPIVADPVTVVRKAWTQDIDAALGARPRADLAVTRLRVAAVPVHASGITVAESPWLRTIRLDLANLGSANASDYSRLTIWAVAHDGSYQFIAEDEAAVPAGTTEPRTYDWDGFGTVGDVTVFASICAYDDANHRNNDARVRSYVGIGGLGVGTRLPPPEYPPVPYCFPVVIVDAMN